MFLSRKIKVNDDMVEILAKENGQVYAKMQLNFGGLFVQPTFGCWRRH